MRFLLDRKAIAFMDMQNLTSTRLALNFHFDETPLLPIITDERDFEFISSSTNSRILNALWIGRIESFKTPILKRLIQDLPLASETSVSLKIVGNGEDKEKLERYTRTLPSGLEILFLGELEGPELTKEIICSDLGFCMGTSSLDVAKYGIPVVCLDYSFVEIDFAISYRFLYEVEGFTLGRELNFEDNFDGRPLSVLLKQLKREPTTIGVRCRRYWEKPFTKSVK